MEGQVVTLITPVGEMIGRLKSETTNTMVLKDPRLFVTGGADGSGSGLAPGICMTGETNPTEVEFQKSGIVGVVKTHPDLEKGWMQATSGIIT